MSSKYEIWGSCTHGEPPEYRNNSSALATEWLAVLTAPKSLSYCTTFPTLTIHIERHDQGWLSNSRHHLNHRGTHSHRCTGSGHRHSRCRRTSSSRAHHYHHECLCRRHHLLDHLKCSIFSFLGIVYFSWTALAATTKIATPGRRSTLSGDPKATPTPHFPHPQPAHGQERAGDCNVAGVPHYASLEGQKGRALGLTQRQESQPTGCALRHSCIPHRNAPDAPARAPWRGGCLRKSSRRCACAGVAHLARHLRARHVHTHLP
jgi:hypothetical protein